MAVNIAQAGDDGSAIQINSIFRNIFGQDCAEAAILYLKCAHMELKIRSQNSGILIEHGHSPSKMWNIGCVY